MSSKDTESESFDIIVEGNIQWNMQILALIYLSFQLFFY